MTQYSKTTLKTFFQTGDIPTGQNYADLIDSCVNQVDTTVQSMAGALNPTELITPRVSATDVNVTGTFSANSLVVNNITGDITASAANITTATITTLSATSITTPSIIATTVSSDAIYASAARIQSGIYYGVGVVSAAGSAQSTAAPLVNIVNRGKGVVDGQTTGYGIQSNRAGLVQYLFNEGASANLWPPTGGTINGLATNAAFSLAASAMVTIVHLTASAMAVK